MELTTASRYLKPTHEQERTSDPRPHRMAQALSPLVNFPEDDELHERLDALAERLEEHQ